MKFQLGEILPRIYHLSFGSGYDLAMHFIRVQEYYESPKFYKQLFSLVDYMEWYSKEKGNGAFTYPKDWSGFNVPSWALLSVYGPMSEIPDPNRYDEFMQVVAQQLHRDAAGRDFYLIGTSQEGHQGDGDEEGVLSHEIAHGLYYIDPNYRRATRDLMGVWNSGRGKPGEVLDSVRDVLKGMGYHESTIEDEVQAYCATGPCRELETILTEEIRAPFVALFEKVSGEHFAKRMK